MAKKPGVRVNLDRLKVLQMALQKVQDGKYSVQVGVFGDKAARKDDAGVTNAEVGIIHEMGSVTHNIPRRSFLWDTFAHHGQKVMASLMPSTKQLYLEGKVEQYLKLVGQSASNLVVEAFETSGWGAWAPNAYSTILRKLRGSFKNLEERRQMAGEVMFSGAGHTKPLIDKGELWQSISYRVRAAAR